MSETEDYYRDLRESNREYKESQNDKRTRMLEELSKDGEFSVRAITLYQFRVNDRLDVYTTWAKWHDIKTGRRGEFKGQNTKEFVREWFKQNVVEGGVGNGCHQDQ